MSCDCQYQLSYVPYGVYFPLCFILYSNFFPKSYLKRMLFFIIKNNLILILLEKYRDHCVKLNRELEKY